jgi:hypothetical protein
MENNTVCCFYWVWLGPEEIFSKLKNTACGVHSNCVGAPLNVRTPVSCRSLGGSLQVSIAPGLSPVGALTVTVMVEVDNIEGLFSYVRLRQCQYTSNNAAVRPASASRCQALPVQSPGLHGGRPSGIPVKTTTNSNFRQAKPTQLKRQEGAPGTAVKPLNYMVVSPSFCSQF